MPRTTEYLNECKKILELSSDYQLAKEWQIDTSSMSQYISGKMKADAYLCFRIAETLNKSPSAVIAEIESENQRNKVKSLYFKHFFTIAGLWITLGGLWQNCGTFSESAFAAGSRTSIDITAHYTKWKRRFLKPKNDKNVGYLTCNWHVKRFALL